MGKGGGAGIFAAATWPHPGLARRPWKKNRGAVEWRTQYRHRLADRELDGPVDGLCEPVDGKPDMDGLPRANSATASHCV